MATHSSALAWRIPGMAGPGGLPFMGSHRVGYNWSNLAAAAAACPLVSDTTQPSYPLSPLLQSKNESVFFQIKIVFHERDRSISNSNNSVQFSHSVVSNSLWPQGLQHVRLPCPSPTPRAYSESCLLSRWCHPTISSSVIFTSHLQSFPASGSFQMSQFCISGGQSIGVSASASVLPMNVQDWFPLGLTGLILQSNGLSTVFSNTTVQKHQLFGTQLSLKSNSHIHTWLLEKQSFD